MRHGLERQNRSLGSVKNAACLSAHKSQKSPNTNRNMRILNLSLKPNELPLQSVACSWRLAGSPDSAGQNPGFFNYTLKGSCPPGLVERSPSACPLLHLEPMQGLQV